MDTFEFVSVLHVQNVYCRTHCTIEGKPATILELTLLLWNGMSAQLPGQIACQPSKDNQIER